MDHVREYGLFIGGDSRPSSSGRIMSIAFPYDGSHWAVVPNADRSDVDAAVAAAREGARLWRATAPQERGRLMRALAGEIARNRDRLAEMETRCNGKLLAESRAQIGAAAKWFDFYATMGETVFGETIPLGKPSTLDFTVREPYGVIAAIVPWNSPALLLGYKVAPALATGNAVVVKPAEQTPVTTLEIAQMASRVGFPAGVFNVITGDGAEAGQALVGHPRIDKVSFTGGTETGRLVAQAAGANLTPTCLELGGKSPNIVFADADMDRALVGVIRGIFSAAGQTCRAGSRLLLEAPIAAQFIDKLLEAVDRIVLGNPLDEGVHMGPIVSERQLAHIDALVQDALLKGAELLAGGERIMAADGTPTLFYRPTILDNVSNDMRVVREEAFGPVLCVFRFDSEADSVRIANDTTFGLSAGVWTRDLNRAMRMVNAIEAGSVWVNTYREASHLVPFGGIKDSGYGRENGLDALLENTHVKNVWIDYSEESGDPFVLQLN